MHLWHLTACLCVDLWEILLMTKHLMCVCVSVCMCRRQCFAVCCWAASLAYKRPVELIAVFTLCVAASMQISSTGQFHVSSHFSLICTTLHGLFVNLSFFILFARGVPLRQSHRCSCLATLPSVGAIPYYYCRLGDFMCFFCMCLLFCCILCCLLFLGFLYFCSAFSFSTLILLVVKLSPR